VNTKAHIRQAIEQSLMHDYIEGKFSRDEMMKQKRARFAAAGVAYKPDEYPSVARDIRDRIETAALNNAIEGYVLSREVIDRLIASEVKATLMPN